MKGAHVVSTALTAAVLVWPQALPAQTYEPVGTSNFHEAEMAKLSASELEALEEELRNAKPLPAPMVEMPAEAIESVASESLPEDALPGLAPGWAPGSGPMPDETQTITISRDHPLYREATGGASLGDWGPVPTNPLNGPYPPFQRWTWYGRYLTYPTSTIGRLFFDTDGNGTRDSSCSASVIGNRVIATAGHCINDGNENWYGWFLFCPSYNQGGINSVRGCWGWTYANVSGNWYFNGALDRDYGCIVTAPTGTVISGTVGSQTGWTGRAWNWGISQPTFVFGYPGNDDFPAYHIIAGASTEWYDVNMTSGDGQVSKYIGGDQHSGNSGGPWWLNLAHASKEWQAVDSSGVTDPFQRTTPGPGGSSPYLNGVYSHKRCAGGSCASPPSTTAGMFWNEMGAAEFRRTSGNGDESEDVFATCYAND